MYIPLVMSITIITPSLKNILIGTPMCSQNVPLHVIGTYNRIKSFLCGYIRRPLSSPFGHEHSYLTLTSIQML